MNKNEAHEVLADHLRNYRSRQYSNLAREVGSVATFEVTTPSGIEYQVEIQILWDGDADKDVRVLGAIDDSGWRAFFPITDSFIMSPDGTFVDEVSSP